MRTIYGIMLNDYDSCYEDTFYESREDAEAEVARRREQKWPDGTRKYNVDELTLLEAGEK